MTTLTSCRACGGQVAPAARTCPHCGEPRPAQSPDEQPEWVTLLLAIVAAGIVISILAVVWR